MSAEKISSFAILIISFCMMIFQFLLALGFPYGKAAWGGEYSVLPKNLRIGSFISALIFILAILISLQELSLITFTRNSTMINILMWFNVILFLLSTFANIMSKSRIEKMIGIPTAFILTISFLILVIKN